MDYSLETEYSMVLPGLQRLCAATSREKQDPLCCGESVFRSDLLCSLLGSRRATVPRQQQGVYQHEDEAMAGWPDCYQFVPMPRTNISHLAFPSASGGGAGSDLSICLSWCRNRCCSCISARDAYSEWLCECLWLLMAVESACRIGEEDQWVRDR